MVRAPYYRAVVDGLTDGATRILREAGATFEQLDVAGAFELPQAIRIALRGSRRFDGFVALGCVVRGETDHYEFICRASMDGPDAGGAAVRHGARHRPADLRHAGAGGGALRPDGHNKGAEAAAAALLQIGAARQLGAA